MSPAHQSVVIDLERIFAAINEERKAAGLPQIEHAVMRVRVNIRLAIKGRERIEGKLPVVLSAEATEELSQVLNSLFQVDLQSDRLRKLSEAPNASASEPDPKHFASSTQPAPEASPAKSAPLATEAPVDEPLNEIYLVDLYVAVNQSRRKAQLPPIEPAVIASRLGIRFSIIRRRRLDFNQASIELSALDLEALQTILADQFDVRLDGGVHELVVAGLRHREEKPRKMTWLERVFRKRTHQVSISTMIMAVMRQRASLGYKPISPTQITAGCEQHLQEMKIKYQPGSTELALNEAQMDQLAEFLRNEYGLFFEDLESFIDPDK